jgi:hypothetical protein
MPQKVELTTDIQVWHADCKEAYGIDEGHEAWREFLGEPKFNFSFTINHKLTSVWSKKTSNNCALSTYELTQV